MHSHGHTLQNVVNATAVELPAMPASGRASHQDAPRVGRS